MLLEVGVAYGHNAHYLLETLPQITYIGVDPYLANYDLSDPFVIDVQRLLARQLPSLSILMKSAQFIDKKNFTISRSSKHHCSERYFLATRGATSDGSFA